MTDEQLALGEREPRTLPACRMERVLDKRPEAWSVEDLVDIFREQQLRLVSLMHVGGDGWIKTLDFVPRGAGHLRDILEGGERADGSNIFRGMGIKPDSSDILLRPRIDTAFRDPFSPLPTLVLLCSHVGRDGEPLPESPDTIVRRADERLGQLAGVELQALGEVEYFLGKRSRERDIYGANDRGYHASSPFVIGEVMRREALGILAEIGVGVKYGHSEVGYIDASENEGRIWEQHEIELTLAPLPRAADAVVLTHWVLRNLAHRNGQLCNFDPIMRKGHAGSGLHFHFCPARDGEALVQTDGGGLHDPARWLIGGLVECGGALMAFGNRNEASLVRLLQGMEAPSGVCWGKYDRSALIRLPVVVTTASGEVTSPPTIEFRLADGSAHPHLLLAGVAQAMAQGIGLADLDQLLERTVADRQRSGEDARPLPTSLQGIADELGRRRAIFEAGDVFPPRLLDAVCDDFVLRQTVQNAQSLL